MGYEYEVHFERWDPPSALAVVRADASYERDHADVLYFRAMGDGDGMPSLFAGINDTHLYVCVNGSSGNELMSRLLSALSAHFGEARVEGL